MEGESNDSWEYSETNGSRSVSLFASVSLMLWDRDRVDHDTGAFAEYVLVKADVQIKIPDNLSDTDAATLGVSTATVVCKLS